MRQEDQKSVCHRFIMPVDLLTLVSGKKNGECSPTHKNPKAITTCPSSK